MRKPMIVFTLVLVLGLAACGGGDGTATSEGDPQDGETVYSQSASPACGFCHSVSPGETLVGPSLAAVAEVAGQRISGQSAEAYLRESIVDPDAYVVEGFGPGIMPPAYGTQLSDAQITDLVAYLMALD
jgi:mono/diheme cytochrome c family protein